MIDPLDEYRRQYAEVHNPTIPLTDEELDGIREIIRKDSDRGGLAGVHRGILLREVDRLRAENTGQAKRFAEVAEIHRPTGLVAVGVEDHDHCLNCDQVWPCATARAIGLYQEGTPS